MREWKAFINEFYSWKWIVLIVVLFPYEGLLRQKLYQIATAYGAKLNQWDLIFHSLNNHIFIFYFLLPVWLIYSCYVLLQEWEYTVLFRTSSFNRWITYTTIRASRSLIWLQCLWFIIVLLVSRGMPYERGWSNYAFNELVPGNYSTVLQESGLDPLLLLILQPVLLSLFLLAVHVSMAAFYVLVPRMSGLTILAVLYFIGGLVSFRRIPPWIVWLKIENFMILSSAVLAWPLLLIAFIVPIGIILFLHLMVWLMKRGFRIPFIRWIKEGKSFWVYFLLCLLGLFSSFTQQAGSFDTIWDYFYGQFFGVSGNGFTLTVYLFYCLVFFGAVYLFQLQLNETTNGFMYYQVVRYLSYYRWFIKLLVKNIAFIGILLLFWALIIMLIGIMKGFSMEGILSVAPLISVNQLVYQYFINGLLQMVNYWLIVFIVHWVWNKTSSNLIVLGFLIVSGMMNSTQFLPAGLNSLGFITGDGTNLLIISLKLIICIAIELAVITFLFTRKKIVHEGEG